MKARRLAGVLAAVMLLSGSAEAAGPGGWSHLGGGSTPALNGAVSALNTDRPGTLYVGGSFTAAGGITGADRIAAWDGTAWQAVSSPASQISNGAVNAIAYDSATGRVFAGGTFTNAGASPNADFLAVWNGTTWAPFCNGLGGPPITATVYALQIIGRTLYVAGAFADGSGIASADRLLACNLDTGASSSTVIDEAHEFNGTMYALTADSNGTLYAGGGFTDLGGDLAADNVAYMDGSGWHAMGSGGGACGCAVDDFVRSLAATGTDVYVGTDATDVAGIPQADHVARWNGSSWSAVGSDAGGTGGWFPASAFINGLAVTNSALAGSGQRIFATGSFQNGGGDASADDIAVFDGSGWHAVGSDGAGNGPWSGNGLDVAVPHDPLTGGPLDVYAGGTFTSAGGDGQAGYLASYALSRRLTVTFVGAGTVAGSGGIQCASTCSADYPTSATVALGAAPQPGSSFLGFTGDCVTLGACQLTMDADRNVTATFSLPPVCTDLPVTAPAGATVAVQLTCSKPGSGSLGYYIPLVSGPHHGTLGGLGVNQLPPADGKVTYTSDAGYLGADGFTYGALLDAGAILPASSNEATVSITVVPPGFAPGGPNVAIVRGALRADASGGLSLSAHNSNAFPVREISVTVTSATAVAAATRRKVALVHSSKAVTLPARKTVRLKVRLRPAGRALLRRLRHVPVRIAIVLQAPNKARTTLHAKRKLFAAARRH